MGRIDRRSWWLILALVVALVVCAVLLDAVLRQPPLALTTKPLLGRQIISPRLARLVARTRGLRGTVRVIAAVAATAGVGLFALALAPRRLARTAATLRAQSGLVLLLGAVTLVACGLLAGLALISVVALPLAALLGVGLGVALALGALAVALALGGALRAQVSPAPSLVADLLVGVLVLGFVVLLPVGRNLVLLALSCAGAGAVLLSRFGSPR